MFFRSVVSALTLFLTFSVGWLSLGAASTVEEDEVLCQPQHVHLSLGEAEDQMAVLWATNGTCDTKAVYGTSQWLTSEAPDHTVTGRAVQYTEHNEHGLHTMHKVMLKGLQGSKTYFYRPTSNNIGAGPFYFQTSPQGTEWSPDLLVVGDLGEHLELLPKLTEETFTGQYSAVLQLGGLSPFLADQNGTRADRAMKGVEHMAAFIPVMTAPGQHETANGQFPAYRHRFSMPGSSWPMREDRLWYSFNLGPVHFISLCTDVYLRGNKTQENLQNGWLVKDLTQANADRQKRPWIVAFGYHPLYCTPGGGNSDHDCAKSDSLVRKGLEDTLFYYGVDLILTSHPGASYERFYPLFKDVVLSTNYTNPGAPVHILSGLATTATTSATATKKTTSSSTAKPSATTPTTTKTSNAPKSGSANSTNTTSSDTKSSSSSSSSSSKSSSSGSDGSTKVDVQRKESDASKENKNLTAFKFVDGTLPTYGRLHIINATHAHWELLAGSGGEEGGKKERKVLDSVMVVQEHHGKFHLKDLSSDVEKKINENLVRDGADGSGSGVANGGKPGVLNVHDPVLENKKMLAADDNRRLIIGASFGGVVLLIIIIVIALKVKGRTKRRSVRRWDVMDYKYGKTKLYTPTSNEEDEDDFQDDHDFEMDIPDGSMQTKKLINGK